MHAFLTSRASLTLFGAALLHQGMSCRAVDPVAGACSFTKASKRAAASHMRPGDGWIEAVLSSASATRNLRNMLCWQP